MGKEEADPDDIVEHAGYSDESAKELEQHRAINKLDVGKDFAGPRSERKCTDVLWLLLIVAHWIAVTWLGIIAFGWVESGAIGQGRPYILTNWIDHNGWICGKEGHGGAVESKPTSTTRTPPGRGSARSTGAEPGQSGVVGLRVLRPQVPRRERRARRRLLVVQDHARRRGVRHLAGLRDL